MQNFMQLQWIKDTEASIRFLSRIPVRDTARDELPNFETTAHTFPLAGLVIALPAAFVLWSAWGIGFSPLVCAVLSIATIVVTTGALHEDGLADVADGFWGGHTRQRKLEIMRDSAIGTYGTLALILSVALRIALIAQLITVVGGGWATCVFVSTAALSRLAMLQPWSTLEPARKKSTNEATGSSKPSQGLSAAYGMADSQTLLRGALAALPALLLLSISAGLVSVVVSLIILQVVVFLFIALCQQHIQGHTGDTLGATQQLSEIGLLLAVIWTI